MMMMMISTIIIQHSMYWSPVESEIKSNSSDLGNILKMTIYLLHCLERQAEDSNQPDQSIRRGVGPLLVVTVTDLCIQVHCTHKCL